MKRRTRPETRYIYRSMVQLKRIKQPVILCTFTVSFPPLLMTIVVFSPSLLVYGTTQKYKPAVPIYICSWSSAIINDHRRISTSYYWSMV